MNNWIFLFKEADVCAEKLSQIPHKRLHILKNKYRIFVSLEVEKPNPTNQHLVENSYICVGFFVLQLTMISITEWSSTYFGI